MYTYESLTPSQKKLLKDQEMWMNDMGVEYDEERTRIDAIYDLIKRFPTEKIAKDAIESGGDPSVLYLYYHDRVKTQKRKHKKVKRTTKRKSK